MRFRPFHGFAIILAVMILLAIPASAQKLSVGFSLSDWDLDSVASIRYGQVSAVRKPAGEVLVVYGLRDVFRSGGPAVTRPAAFNGDYFLISNFDFQPVNALGGKMGAFFLAPSSAVVDLQTTGDGRRALVLSTTKKSDGFCGAWIHLFQTAAEPSAREFLNSTPFSHLVFWIRGDGGDPQVVLKIADSSWLSRDDAVVVGPIGPYLPSRRVQTDWQQASIPLSVFPPSIDRKALASLALETTASGSHRIEIKGLALALAGAVPPLTSPKIRPLSKAIWVWNTEQILASSAEQEFFLSHLRREGIDLVYLALPYNAGSKSLEMDDPLMMPLLRALHREGIKTQALFGDKEQVLPWNHAFVMDTIRNVIEYNERVPLPARFSGIHLDIEPYLLPGFNSRRRAVFLKNYLLILSEAAALARSAGLESGVDIPPWFDLINEYSADLLPTTHRGQTKPLYEHVIDVMDQVTLMDYRTLGEGTNGTIALAVGELAYAAKRGKKVYVGLETGVIDDEQIFTFRGSPATRPDALPKAPWYACVTGTGTEMKITVVEAREVGAFRQQLKRPNLPGWVELYWPVHSAPVISGSTISFAALGREPLLRLMFETASELSIYSSLAGVAVHDYSSHQKLTVREKK